MSCACSVEGRSDGAASSLSSNSSLPRILGTATLRIRGPARLFAGAKSAADIALSILAETMQIERNVAQQALPVDA